MTLQKKLKKFLNKNIVDIILFGSFVKGSTYNDIDLALVVNDRTKLNDELKSIRGLFKETVDIEIIDISSIHSVIWLTLIKEGFSVKKNKYISSLYGISPKVLFKYSLKKLTNVQKVQFERGIKNVLGDKAVFLTRSVVLIPMNMRNEMIDFLKTWDIYYESKDYELIPLLRKGEI